jgi:antimicrobial peptide system SdpA family protein
MTAIVMGWLFVFYLVATNTIPYNSSSMRILTKDKLFLRAVLPEGFSFFTRNPREPQVVLLSKSDGAEVDLNNNAPDNLFGLSRYSRALNLEMSVIWNAVRNETWHSSDSHYDLLSTANVPNYVIADSFPEPFLSGDYYLKVSEPIPWAWAKVFRQQNRAMPFKIVGVTIKTEQ